MTNPAIYDEQLGQYTISYEGIQFCWDDEFKDLHYFAIDGWYIFHDFASMTYMWSLLCYIHLITFCISIFAIDLDGFRFSAICYMK